MSTAERHIPVSESSREGRAPIRIVKAKDRKLAGKASEAKPLTQRQTEREMRTTVSSWIAETEVSKSQQLARDQRQFDGIVKTESVN